MLLVLSSCVKPLMAQLTGTKNVPGDYPTLAAAIADLNAQGVGTGGVIINMNTPETAPAGGYVLTATSIAANPIVLEGNNSMITASSSHTVGSISDGIFKIVGGDYIHIQNFTMQENPANTNNVPGTNTMTEWGVALLYATPTNGASMNTISGNTISLDRTYSNTFGIYSNVRHTATAPTVAAEIATSSGRNVGNIVRSNQISNVNMGITFIGSSQPFWMDTNNDIGGNSAATGNTITNWGGDAAASAYVSNVATSYGILVNHQLVYNISWNTLTSAAVAPTTGFRGIIQEYTLSGGPGNVTNTISNNVITMTSGQTSGVVRGIEANGGMTSNTLYIVNNSIRNCLMTNSAAPLFTGILQTGSINYLYITGNIFEGNATNSTSGGFTAISNTGFVGTSININNNDLGTTTGALITFNAATSGAVTGIINSGGMAGCRLYIEGNDIRGIVHAVNGSSPHTYISNTAANPYTSIRLNTFTALSVNTTGDVTFISNSVTHAANTTHDISSNSVVGGYTKGLSGGTVYFYYAAGGSGTSVSEINFYNNFTNMSFTGLTLVQGWVNTDGAAISPYGPTKIMANNVFTNISSGFSPMQIMQMDRCNCSANSGIDANTISNITASGNVTGIVTTEGCQDVASNVISGLHSTGTAGSVTAVFINGGVTQDVFKNHIYNLQADGANSSVAAIKVAATASTRLDNNMVGNLYAPNASGVNPVTGINVTAATGTIEIYYNTIYLDAVSTGVNFGSTGINVTTGPSIDLRNNLIVNLSAANGTGATVAYRRSSASLANYSTLSGNNSFYAGTPSPSHLIYSDGTNNDQTLAAFKSRVAPADAASITHNAPFLSTAGASVLFLHIPSTAPSPLECGAVTISTISGDIDGHNRPGPTGSIHGGGFAPDIGADEFDGGLTCAGMPTSGSASVFPASVCDTGTFTLTVSGESIAPGIAYQWQQSTVSGGPYTNIPGATAVTYYANPGVTMYYVLLVTCTYGESTVTSNEIVALVNPSPPVQAHATDTLFCAGENVTLTGSGAASYSWSGGINDGVPFVPLSSGLYTVTGTDVNGCQQSDSIAITLAPLPVVMAVATSDTLCNGAQVALSGSGADVYTWSGNVNNNVPFTPSATDSYTVTGTDQNGCTGTDSISIIVHASPFVEAHVSDSAVCAGATVTCSGSGALSYSWSGGVTDNVPFTPGITNVYVVTGSDTNGCTNTDSIAVTVYALPEVVAAVSADTICFGSSVIFTGSGAMTYVWNNGVQDNVSYTPTATSSYNVTGTDGNGCSDSASLTVIVNPLPVVQLQLTQDTACLTAGSIVLMGSSPAGGTWSGPGVNGNTFDPVAAGTGMITIVYMYMDSITGCSASAIDSMQVDICNGVIGGQMPPEILIYPNPSSGVFNLESGEVSNIGMQVEILNVNGQITRSFVIAKDHETLDLTDEANGVYFLRITRDNQIAVFRVIKL